MAETSSAPRLVNSSLPGAPFRTASFSAINHRSNSLPLDHHPRSSGFVM